MRVIAGSKKGVDLRCGHGPFFRPTAQIVKGSVFDTVGFEIEGRTILDLFAGSGAIGIEALSRGASRAVFIEQDRRILKALRTNLERCGFDRPRAEVHIADAIRYLERAARSAAFFDIVFADPPYAAKNAAQRVIDIVDGAEAALCRVLVVEHARVVFAKEGGSLSLVKARRFGQTTVSYFRYGKEAGNGEGKDSSLPGDV
ncbi:MAG: 16S rRNA (guanine(966)-N(2))-methyltransferase RsmD [Candidatus Krumholzibacteria bacterium]|nr:16S rRNA (guanine(966)-N(2))-methyltransferase RsmD [Candidatus Krumholzibacteria bacterium]